MLDHQPRTWLDPSPFPVHETPYTPPAYIRHTSYPTPPPTRRVRASKPGPGWNQQDYRWLGELQRHAADHEYLKPVLEERRLALQQRQARLNFWTREIQDRQRQVRDPGFSRGAAQRRELQVQLQTLLRDREVARRDYQKQQAEFDLLSRRVQSHRESIDGLVQRLRVIVSS